MNLHEYQAKALLKGYGIPVPEGGVAHSADEAARVVRALGGARWVVKAQIHAGLRQKAGGVRLVDSPDAVREAAAELLGATLVTPQTGPDGKIVKAVYVENGIDFTDEIYLAALIDRAAGRVALIGSAEGGANIEDRVAEDPTVLERLIVDPDIGLERDAATTMARRLGLDGAAVEQAADIMAATFKAFVENDASLIEFNPLVVGKDGGLVALDIKMVIDDNALFRHQGLESLRDYDEVDPTELEAKRFELNYVRLAGDVGMMVNGAGLALATVDLLEEAGSRPANFMDVRPEATRAEVANGFRLLLKDPRAKAILVNIYGGGILRCDTVAEGIAAAWRDRAADIPLIVRFAGTNAEVASKALAAQNIPARFADNLAEAAMKAARAARGEAI